MSEEELETNGLNTSLVHDDFMIGSSRLNIFASTKSEEIVQIFENGNWSI